MKPFAIIIRDPIGVGKSTIANLLAKKLTKAAHIDIDKFKHAISPESSKYRTKLAHQMAQTETRRLVRLKHNIIIEELFRPGDYRAIKKLFKDTDYKVLKIYLKVPLKTLVERDKARKVKTKGEAIVHNIYSQIKAGDEDLILDTAKLSKAQILRAIFNSLRENNE